MDWAGELTSLSPGGSCVNLLVVADPVVFGRPLLGVGTCRDPLFVFLEWLGLPLPLVACMRVALAGSHGTQSCAWPSCSPRF